MFAPLPDEMTSDANPVTTAKVDLGRMLYYEHRISRSHKFSCNSCHGLDTYGVDNEPTSLGHRGQRGDRNSPTVYNAAGHVAQFWDGRAKTVEEQSKGPVLNPVEMAMPSEPEVVATLKSMPGYVEAFQKAFPDDKDPVTFENYALAVGAFERKLVTPSRWDQFLKGDRDALIPAERAGLVKFVETGCVTCHSGPYVGGQMFQRLGIAKPWPDQTDLGRFKVTGSEADKMVFKVPSLRNIEKTAPFYHNGKVRTLEEAVPLMAEYELGKRLTQQDVDSIVTWLKSLTGEIPAEYIRKPELPASTARTPAPQETD